MMNTLNNKKPTKLEFVKQTDKHIPFYQLEGFPSQHIHYGTYGTALEEARVQKEVRID